MHCPCCRRCLQALVQDDSCLWRTKGLPATTDEVALYCRVCLSWGPHGLGGGSDGPSCGRLGSGTVHCSSKWHLGLGRTSEAPSSGANGTRGAGGSVATANSTNGRRRGQEWEGSAAELCPKEPQVELPVHVPHAGHGNTACQWARWDLYSSTGTATVEYDVMQASAPPLLALPTAGAGGVCWCQCSAVTVVACVCTGSGTVLDVEGDPGNPRLSREPRPGRAEVLDIYIKLSLSTYMTSKLVSRSELSGSATRLFGYAPRWTCAQKQGLDHF